MSLAERYQDEWRRALQARGQRPNGTPEQEAAARALLAFKPYQPKRLTVAQALTASAKAWRKALAAETASYLPLPEGGEGLTYAIVTRARTFDENHPPARKHAMVAPSFTRSVRNGKSAPPVKGAQTRRYTMSKTEKTSRPLSGPQLAEKVLEEAGRPVHRSLIAERTVAADRARKPADRSYKGKTPEQTIAAALEVSNVKGGTFVKVSPGVFGLRAWTAAKLSKAPEMPEGKTAKRAEPKSEQPAAQASAASITAAKSRAKKTAGKASPAKPSRKRRGPKPEGIDALAAEHSTLVSAGS